MIHITSRYIRMLFRILSVFLVTFLLGCGTTRERMATDQLLLSDAVDRSVARIDFSPLAGETVFLDSQYVRSVKTNLFVNADYIISSLRQQMLLAGCLLQDSRDEADIIVEARVGTLGQDAHDLNVGLPANNTIQTAAELVNNAPPLPAIPEISLLKKSEDSAAAKIAVFAFRREAKTPVWQSGLSVARSTAKNKWIFGAGPFQSGEIYKGTYFAGERLRKNTFNPSYPPHVLDEQAFRNAAVLESDLTQKLRESPKVEHVAKSGSTSEKLRRIPDSEVATTDEIEKTPNVVTAEHVESVESTRVE